MSEPDGGHTIGVEEFLLADQTLTPAGGPSRCGDGRAGYSPT
jgi:hypothetical protein